MDSVKKLSVLLLLSAHSARVAAERRKCYYPNGEVVLADSPCDSDAEHSACCGAPPFGIACLSNKLCETQPGDTSRGSCTDPTWQSPECPSFCMHYSGIGVTLERCPNANGADTYCCPSTSESCCDDSASGQLTLGTLSPFTWAEWVGSSTGYYTVATPLPSTSKTNSASSKTTDTVYSSSSTSTSATETGPANSQQTTNPNDQSPGLSTGAQAGIGVGVAAAVLLIAGGIFLWLRLAKQHNAHKDMGESLGSGPGDLDSNHWDPKNSMTVGASELPLTAEKYELVAPHVPHAAGGYTDAPSTVKYAAIAPHYPVQLPADERLYAELPANNDRD